MSMVKSQKGQKTLTSKTELIIQDNLVCLATRAGDSLR